VNSSEIQNEINMKLLKIAYKLTIIILLIGIFSLMSSSFSRLILILITSIEFFILFKMLFIDSERKDWIKNLATWLFSFVMLLFLLEAIFMFICQSSATGIPLASENWYKKYFYPGMNSYGFRDEEPGKKSKFQLGIWK